jgi:hypothetical protein
MLQGYQYLQNLVIPTVMADAVATGLFVSLASFTQPPTTQGPTGNTTGAFTAIAGLQNIPCFDSPESIRIVPSDEKKTVPTTEAGQYRHVLLNAWYPQVNNGAGQGWRVTVDGVLYDLLGADQDSQSTQTRLRLQLVTL